MTDYGATNAVFINLAAPTISIPRQIISDIPLKIITAFGGSGPVRGSDGLVWPTGVQRFGSAPS